jgi:DNA-binding response OmpR family regulator
VLDTSVEIRTPFQWLTKRDIVQLISDHGFAGLIGKTSSCANPRSWNKEMSHCGACSQCIDRRFAILAAGLEEFDPAGNYGVDLLLGPRSDELELRMAVSYVKFFQGFAALDERMFLSEHPAVTTALRSIRGMSSDEALEAIYALYRRHADDVLRALEDGAKRHARDFVRGAIPAGSIMSMCAPGARIETQPPSDYDRQVREFMDRLPEPRCEFAVDERTERIVFRGGFALTGTNYRLVHTLLRNFRSGKERSAEVQFMRPDKLADSLQMDEQSLRQQIRRLRNEVSERLAVDQDIPLGRDDFIENRQGAGYRLNPAVREVLLGDVMAPPRAVSHA